MSFELAYGQGKIELEIPGQNLLAVLTANPVTAAADEQAEISRALAEPIASLPLAGLVQAGDKVAIVTSDITRPLPSYKLLPPVLAELNRAGVGDGDITVVFALGSHRRHSREEMQALVGGEVFGRVRCVDGGSQGFVRVGTTESGTPLDVCRLVAAADRRVCLGNIEYHYFAGYSGGAKAIMPGVSTRAAIQANHRMMVLDKACAGNITDNPLRRDIDAIGHHLAIDFILNVILDEKKRIIRAVAGHYIDAHRAGCEFLDRLYKVKIPRRADIVITSPGGFPKDINLYQAQKALDNAKYAVKPGGTVILVAECREGFGEEVFEQWISEADSADRLISRVESGFRLGGHKAAAIAMVRKMADIYLVSALSHPKLDKLCRQFADGQAALDAALAKSGPTGEILLIPQGGSILPSGGQ
ncbi:MAG: nickel-dependent lactate racemase [Negativicutes bacterium]|nr:nickel-dependent lactate racemase [Negativicutes bacterium]